MIKLPLISVIVPVYNVENYLKECLDSIVSQTYENLEIILIDDGSTDDSGQICDMYAQKDLRIKVVHQDNGGLSFARNQGMLYAKGEYIAFVDSDDWIETNMYELLLEAMLNHQADLVLCKHRYIEQEDVRKENVDSEKEKIFIGHELLEEYIRENEIYQISPSVWDRLYHRSILNGMEFPVGRVHEDILFTVEVFCRSRKAVHLDISLYNYRVMRKGAITCHHDSLKNIQDKIYLMGRVLNHLERLETNDLADYYLFHYYYYFLLTYMESQDIEVQKSLKKALGEIGKKARKLLKLGRGGEIKAYDKLKLAVALISPRLFQCSSNINMRIRGNRRKL